MRKFLSAFLLCGFSSLTLAQTSGYESSIFIKMLSEKSQQEMSENTGQRTFDEKTLAKLLALSGARINFPKGSKKKIKWSEYSLVFPESVTLKNAQKFHESVISKIETTPIGKNPEKNHPERALAKAIFQRDLLDHYLKSKRYVEASEARAKLEAMSAEAKKKK